MATIDPTWVLLDHQTLAKTGCVILRALGDGRMVGVCAQITNACIAIGPMDCDEWDDTWDYATLQAALDAWCRWDPLTQEEPENWVRHPRTARRRPDGDATQEVIRP